MASLENPASILYDEGGVQLAVTASVAIPSGSSGILAAGVDSGGIVRYVKLGTDGTMQVAGTVATTTTPNTLVAQGNSGSFAQAWNVVLSDGTKAIGGGSAAPVYTIDANVSSATVTSVNRNAASVTILASNPNRKGGMIYNDSIGNNPNLYIIFGSTATTSSFTAKIGSNGYFDIPSWYTGLISGIWGSAGTGAAKVTEG